jgi:hypothetical protein
MSRQFGADDAILWAITFALVCAGLGILSFSALLIHTVLTGVKV